MTGTVTAADPGRLTADCSRCFALCCVALPLTVSADFAIDKAAGTPCPNLREDFGCGIHSRLRESGFPGCTVYDCFGAGQQVAQHTYGGVDWRTRPESAEQMFAVFAVVRRLHEMLLHLTTARALPTAAALGAEVARSQARTDELTTLGPDALLGLDLDAHQAAVGDLLARVSEQVRGGRGRRLRRADLVGARLGGADLRAADLRGASLVGAGLREADLRGADLLGADLRGALFLTGPQLAAARGDGATRLDAALPHPRHWAIGHARGAREPGAAPEPHRPGSAHQSTEQIIHIRPRSVT